MSKKTLIKRIKNGYEHGKNGIEIKDVGKYLKYYLSKFTCKMTSQQKQKIKEEYEDEMIGW